MKPIQVITKNLVKAGKSDYNKCENCGALCCIIAGYVDVTKEEHDNIIVLDPKYKDYFTTQGRDIIIKKEHKGLVCPFLLDSKCSIYEHRGLTCREYDCSDDIDTLNIKNVLFPDSQEIEL